MAWMRVAPPAASTIGSEQVAAPLPDDVVEQDLRGPRKHQAGEAAHEQKPQSERQPPPAGVEKLGRVPGDDREGEGLLLLLRVFVGTANAAAPLFGSARPRGEAPAHQSQARQAQALPSVTVRLYGRKAHARGELSTIDNYVRCGRKGIRIHILTIINVWTNNIVYGDASRRARRGPRDHCESEARRRSASPAPTAASVSVA